MLLERLLHLRNSGLYHREGLVLAVQEEGGEHNAESRKQWFHAGILTRFANRLTLLGNFPPVKCNYGDGRPFRLLRIVKERESSRRPRPRYILSAKALREGRIVVSRRYPDPRLSRNS